MSDLRHAIIEAVRGGASTSPEIAAAVGLEHTNYRLGDTLNDLIYDRALIHTVDEAGFGRYAVTH